MGHRRTCGLPKAMRDKLNEHIVRTMYSSAMAERIKAQYLDVWTSSADEFRKVLEADVGKWNKIVKESGATLD